VAADPLDIPRFLRRGEMSPDERERRSREIEEQDRRDRAEREAKRDAQPGFTPGRRDAAALERLALRVADLVAGGTDADGTLHGALGPGFEGAPVRWKELEEGIRRAVRAKLIRREGVRYVRC
jgi:hypothetical protein